MHKLQNWSKSGLAFGLATLTLSQGAMAAACGRYELHAHRGAAEFPENSVPAALHAMDLRYDAVELDLQQLKDKVWIIHHDPVFGRVVKPNIDNTTINRLRGAGSITSAEWAGGRVRDRSGQSSDVPPPFLKNLIQEISRRSSTIPLNLEIKTQASCNSIKALHDEIRLTLKAGSVMYSSFEMDVLTCLREADPKIYLGVVVAPETDSLPVKIDTVRELARRLSPKAEKFVNDQSSAYQSNHNRQHLNESSFELISNQLNPMGFHMDAMTLAKNPNLLKYARNSRAKVFSYSTKDDASHIAQLVKTKALSGSMPDGMIIDGKPDVFCGQLKINGL